MRDELVEAVAKAIYELRPDGGTIIKCVGTMGTNIDYQHIFKAVPWDEASETSRRDLMKFAQAAIAAIQASLPADVKAMVEKLEASLHVTAGRTVYVNPAGRAAAAMLTRLSARIADLEAQIARDKAEWVEIPRMTMGKQTDG